MVENIWDIVSNQLNKIYNIVAVVFEYFTAKNPAYFTFNFICLSVCLFFNHKSNKTRKKKYFCCEKFGIGSICYIGQNSRTARDVRLLALKGRNQRLPD